MPEETAEVSSLADDLGYLLARARAERGLTIDTIAATIHMRKHYVQAMEAGRFDELPGATYARGYLKRYAEFLELNTATVLEKYDQLVPDAPRKFFMLSGSLERNPYPSIQMVLMSLILAIVSMVWWSYAHRQSTVALVEPYAPFENMAHARALPHRCEAERAAYPPCYWEDLKLWYLPYKPSEHFFTVVNHHDVTP